MAKQRVWDLPVRLFHWSLVCLVSFLWYTGEEGGFDTSFTLGQNAFYFSNMDWHATAGQAIWVLVVFRLLWGLWGSNTARFSHFIKGPRAVVAEIKALLAGKTPDHFGHNPLGALMVIALLLTLIAQATLGMCSADDLFFSGPLTAPLSEEQIDLASRWHDIGFKIVMLLVLTHVSAIVYYRFKGQNLIKPMVTGQKDAMLVNQENEYKSAPLWAALVSLAMAILLLRVLIYAAA